MSQIHIDRIRAILKQQKPKMGMIRPADALEAANLNFEDDNIIITQENIKFEIDFKQFFQYYKVLNAKFLANRIGMNPTLLSQYVQGHKKPSETQTEKILHGIHQIGQELSDINLIYKH